MAKDNKITLLGCDNVETPRQVIETDKDTARKKAFLAAYERTKLIVPEFFIKKKPKNTSGASGGNGLSQKITITTEVVKLETKDNQTKEVEEDRERE